MGVGARSIRRASGSSDSYPIHTGSKRGKLPKPNRQTLEGLLAWGQKEEEKCKEQLKLLPPEMEEYNQVLQRLENLQSVLLQVRQQLVVRRKGE